MSERVVITFEATAEAEVIKAADIEAATTEEND